MSVENSIFHEIGQVISNEEIALGIYETIFQSSKISETSLPGQFINILPQTDWKQVMRRPMSIAKQGDGKLSIIYKAIGEGTRIMSDWVSGSAIDFIGPLGNYWSGYESTFPILIGGGVGIAPILNLHDTLIAKNVNHILIMGARTRDEHFLNHDPEKQIYMSTDDGSLGLKGNVVDALNQIISNKNNMVNAKIFSCGPPRMMESVKSYSIENNLKCDLALETIMACGIGICQGCTVERRVEEVEHTYRNRFSLACIDGPIFCSKEIVKCG